MTLVGENYMLTMRTIEIQFFLRKEETIYVRHYFIFWLLRCIFIFIDLGYQASSTLRVERSLKCTAARYYRIGLRQWCTGCG